MKAQNLGKRGRSRQRQYSEPDREAPGGSHRSPGQGWVRPPGTPASPCWLEAHPEQSLGSKGKSLEPALRCSSSAPGLSCTFATRHVFIPPPDLGWENQLRPRLATEDEGHLSTHRTLSSKGRAS